MKTNYQRPLLLIEEALAGLRDPGRFDEGESVLVCAQRMFDRRIVFLPATICTRIGPVKYEVRMLADGSLDRVYVFDLLKLAAVESSSEL